MRALRRDETEPEIIEALEDLGLQVQQLPGTPDLVVRNPATEEITLLEVEGVTRNRKRSAKQLAHLKAWRIPVVKTPEQAIRAVTRQ